MNIGEKKVTVELMGKIYTVRGDADPEYMAGVARYVNEKISEMKKMVSNDQTKMLLLACLNLADELFQARKGVTTSSHDAQLIQKRTENLLKMLETGLVGKYEQ